MTKYYKYNDGLIVDYINKTYQVVKNEDVKGDNIYKYILLSYLGELKLKSFLKENNFKMI